MGVDTPTWFEVDQLPKSFVPDEEELDNTDNDEVLAQSSSDEENAEEDSDNADVYVYNYN